MFEIAYLCENVVQQAVQHELDVLDVKRLKKH